MKLSSITLAAVAAAALGCASSAQARACATEADSSGVAAALAETSASTVYGINPADMNPSVGACKDFNEYANGGWLKANAIPPDQSYWGSFTVLEETNRANLRKVLEKGGGRQELRGRLG